MTKKPRENRVPIMMSDDEVRAIDDWRFRNRVATRSDAVRKLAQGALAADRYMADMVALQLSVASAAVGAKGKMREFLSSLPDPQNLSSRDVLYLSAFVNEAFREMDLKGRVMAEMFFAFVEEVNLLYGSSTVESGLSELQKARNEADEKLADWRDDNDALDIIDSLTLPERLARLK